MKLRQPRHDVSISARVQSDLTASDAWILNASSRGLLLHAMTPPAAGSYVELHAEDHVIVARIVWVNGHQFGVQTQDKVSADLVPCLRPLGAVSVSIVPRPSPGKATFDNARSLGRMLQFASIVIFSVAAASLAFESVEKSLSNPILAARTALQPGTVVRAQ